MDATQILSYFRSREADWVALLERLTGLDCPTGDVELNARFLEVYRGLLEGEGLVVREIPGPAGKHLVADTPGGDGEPRVVLVTHSDTVWPRGECARRPPRIESGRLYGPGSLDMRAGLVLAVAVARFLREARPADAARVALRIFVSADEENGSLTAREPLAREVPDDALALVLEPPAPGGALKLRRKGVGIYRLRLTGKAAHAGIAPEDGVSAVDGLVEVIEELHRLRDSDRGITLNVGTIRGGTASNVIAQEAELSLDLRFRDPEDGQRVDEAIRRVRPADSRIRLELEGGIVFPPLVLTPGTGPIVERVQELGEELGLALPEGESGGGSDGCLLSERGVRTLDGLGVEGEGAHALHEHVELAYLAPRAALLARIVLEYGV